MGQEGMECVGKRENVHGPEATMLPSDPLLRDGVVIRVVVKAELVLWIVVLGQIVQDCGALEDGKVIALVCE